MNRYLWQGVILCVLGSLCGFAAKGDEDPAGSTSEIANDAPDLPDRLEVGLGLRFMPIGWFDMPDVANRSFRAYPALGFAPFVDYRLSRFFSVGISPEVTLNVIPNRSGYHVGEMLVLNMRLSARYPHHALFEPYAIVTGGYSVIWRNEASTASGPAVGATLGLRLKFAQRHAVFAELSYQRGFQRIGGQAYSPSYLIMGAGWQVGF